MCIELYCRDCVGRGRDGLFVTSFVVKIKVDEVGDVFVRLTRIYIDVRSV